MKIENPNKKDMLIGLIWCVLGIAVTFISYFMSSAGESYSIFYGAILWGAYQAGRGWVGYLRELRAAGDTPMFNRWILIGGCAVVSIGALTYASWDIMHASAYEDKPQTVDVAEYGFTLNLPEGFAKVETESWPETDSTYAYSKLFTYDEGFYYSLEMTQYYEPDTLTIEDIREHLTLQAISYTDSLLIYPEIVTVGDKMTLRSVGVDNDEVVCVSHDMIHKGNIVSVFSYQEGTEVDSLQLACVAEFIRDYIVLY